jgi:hypothetical protein
MLKSFFGIFLLLAFSSSTSAQAIVHELNVSFSDTRLNAYTDPSNFSFNIAGDYRYHVGSGFQVGPLIQFGYSDIGSSTTNMNFAAIASYNFFTDENEKNAVFVSLIPGVRLNWNSGTSTSHFFLQSELGYRLMLSESFAWKPLLATRTIFDAYTIFSVIPVSFSFLF